MTTRYHKKAPRVLILASDEGYGHIVRQEAVIKELLRRLPQAEITLQTKIKLPVVKEKFGERIFYRERYNNLHTIKTSDGCLDLEQSHKILQRYKQESARWIEEMLRTCPYDFIISDFVPEAFELASQLKIPSFGVAHFTWDWFYSLLYPGENGTLALLEKYSKKATRLYFPPFTPRALLNKYQTLSKQVSFIINDFAPIQLEKTQLAKCLIMDNGTHTLTRLIEASIDAFKKVPGIQFYLAVDHFSPTTVQSIKNSSNIVPISGLKTMHSYIPKVDFVLARGGFNTLTECLISRTPALLVEEGRNPEVTENIRLLTEAGFASRLETTDFGPRIRDRIVLFLEKEIRHIKQKLEEAHFENTGPSEICADILGEVEKYYG